MEHVLKPPTLFGFLALVVTKMGRVGTALLPRPGAVSHLAQAQASQKY